MGYFYIQIIIYHAQQCSSLPNKHTQLLTQGMWMHCTLGNTKHVETTVRHKEGSISRTASIWIILLRTRPTTNCATSHRRCAPHLNNDWSRHDQLIQQLCDMSWLTTVKIIPTAKIKNDSSIVSRILTTKHLSWSDQTYAAAALKSVWTTWQQLLLELLTNWRPAAAADTKSSKQLEPASCKEAKTVGGGMLMCCLTEPCLDTVGGSQSSSKPQAAALRLP